MDLYLLRHAMPVIEPATPPASWPLSSDGVAAAARLGRTSRLWVSHAAGSLVVAASDEPKARGSVAALLAVPAEEVQASPEFREVRRVEAFHPGFRADRRRWVSGEAIPDWELFDVVAGRFAQGVVSLLEAAAARRATAVLVGTHGMALTAYLVANGHLGAGEEAASFWEALAFPDLWCVQDLGRSSARLFRAVRTAAD